MKRNKRKCDTNINVINKFISTMKKQKKIKGKDSDEEEGGYLPNIDVKYKFNAKSKKGEEVDMDTLKDIVHNIILKLYDPGLKREQAKHLREQLKKILEYIKKISKPTHKAILGEIRTVNAKKKQIREHIKTNASHKVQLERNSEQLAEAKDLVKRLTGERKGILENKRTGNVKNTLWSEIINLPESSTSNNTTLFRSLFGNPEFKVRKRKTLVRKPRGVKQHQIMPMEIDEDVIGKSTAPRIPETEEQRIRDIIEENPHEQLETAEEIQPTVGDDMDIFEMPDETPKQGSGLGNTDRLKRFNKAVRKLRKKDPSLSFRQAQQMVSKIYHGN